MDIEDTVKQIRLIDKSIAIAYMEKDKLESGLLFYLESIGANEFPDSFDVDGEIVTVQREKIKGRYGTFDQSALVALKELLSPENYDKVYKPGYTKEVQVPGKYDGVKLNAVANKYGGEIKEAIEKARLPVSYKLKIKSDGYSHKKVETPMAKRKKSPIKKSPVVEPKFRPKGSVAFARYLAGARDTTAVNAAKKFNELK